ncbi:hypothetical protein BDW66DRAFT_146782 [Aspergillus desertorum]
MPSNSNRARPHAPYPSRHTDTDDFDAMPYQDDYDWEREETHLLPAPLHLHSHTNACARTPSPDTDSDPDLYDATPPRAKKNPFLDLELLNRTPRPPAMLTQLQKVVEELKADPIEPMLEQLRRNMEMSKMIGILLEAEAALLKGDTDIAQRKANSAWLIAASLEDAEYCKRCDVLQGFAEKLRALQERGNWRDECGDDDEKGTGKEIVPVTEQGPGRGQRRSSGSDAGSVEVMDVLKEKSMFEREEWAEEEEEEEEGEEEGEEEDGDYVRVKVRGQHAERRNSVGFNPRQLQSPAPPEEEDDEYEEMALPRYDPRSASANSQGSSSSSSSSSSSYTEDCIDSEAEADSITILNLSTPQESSVRGRLARKRKGTLIAPSTTLTYTHIHHTKRKPYTLTQPPIVGPSRPKPWTPSDANATADEDFHRVFWNTHSKTLLLQQPVYDWDMSWLPRYESSPFTPPKAHFIFRFSLPMQCMASRVRKTVIFPRQEWEFIPNPAEWRRFCEGMTNGERVTMSFLEWERERIEGLMLEDRGGEIAAVRSVQRAREMGANPCGHADASHKVATRGDQFAKMSDARLKKEVTRRARAVLEGDWNEPGGGIDFCPGMSDEELLRTRMVEPLEDDDDEDGVWECNLPWPIMEQIALFVFVCACLRILYVAGLRAFWAVFVKFWVPSYDA